MPYVEGFVECWGDDVPRGEVTDFYKAAQAKDDETVIFSWIEYPDKETRDRANGKRMIFGGFVPVIDA